MKVVNIETSFWYSKVSTSPENFLRLFTLFSVSTNFYAKRQPTYRNGQLNGTPGSSLKAWLSYLTLQYVPHSSCLWILYSGGKFGLNLYTGAFKCWVPQGVRNSSQIMITNPVLRKKPGLLFPVSACFLVWVAWCVGVSFNLWGGTLEMWVAFTSYPTVKWKKLACLERCFLASFKHNICCHVESVIW